jgi:hypothetical protein
MSAKEEQEKEECEVDIEELSDRVAALFKRRKEEEKGEKKEIVKGLLFIPPELSSPDHEFIDDARMMFDIFHDNWQKTLDAQENNKVPKCELCSYPTHFAFTPEYDKLVILRQRRFQILEKSLKREGTTFKYMLIWDEKGNKRMSLMSYMTF